MTTHFRDLLSRVGREEDAVLRLELDLDEADMPKVAALPWSSCAPRKPPGGR